MAERSFAKEVEKLKKGEGEVFHGEGILAITKALLENGVGYVGGYQGAPISHLMDVLADAQDILSDLDVHFEASASEAAATAMLAASVHYPIRGAVTFKSTVGTNVASDALANLSSGGVTGGALIIVGEDYGEGSSIMQERSHAFAMKSQVWLLDPRPNLPSIVKAVGDGFELSEVSNTPVMLQVRIRGCHVHGRFETRDNKRPEMSVAEALENPRRDLQRIVLPPASFLHEQEKVTKRLPSAIAYIRDNKLNETFGPDKAKVGIVLQGGMYNGVIRALQRLGLADFYGETMVPLHVLNVTYPMLDDEIVGFCKGKDAVLVVEEGHPDYIEQAIAAMLYADGASTKLAGKGPLPEAGELTGQGHARRASRLPARVRPGAFVRSGPFAQRAECAGHRRPCRRGASAATGFLHRLPGTADLRRHQAGAGGIGRALHRLRHRLPPVLHHAALRAGRHHDGLRPRAGVGIGFQRARGQSPLDLLRRRWWFLAQRPDIVGRQRRLQQERRGDRRRRQLLCRRHRRPGHPVVARRQPVEIDQAPDHRGGEGGRRQMGAPDRSHLRCRQDGGDPEGGADHQGKGSQGHRRVVRMHAQPAAPPSGR